MAENEKSLDANTEPDAILEYLFVERDFNQEDPVKYNKGTFYDSIDLFFTGKNKNADFATFRKLLPLKVRARADELIYFEDRAIDLHDYKYGVIDEDKEITEFDSIDENFFNALKKTLKLIIFGKDFDLERFKTHKVFEDFYNFIHGIFDEEKMMDNIVEPDAIVEYLFVEKAETQLKAINDDQGYIMAYMNIFFSGEFTNNTLKAFKTLLLDELIFSLNDLNYFKNKSVDLDDYKFFLIDNDKNSTEFAVMDEKFFESLIKSMRNLVIVGKNFDLEKFKHHEIFEEWFEKYSNRF